MQPSPTRRQKRVANLIKKELSDILVKQGFTGSDETVVTVRKVEISVDMQWADVGVSVYPEKHSSKVIENLDENVYDIQGKLNDLIEMKHVPKLRFSIDNSLKKGQELNKMIEELNK